MRNVYWLLIVILTMRGYREDTHQKITLGSEISLRSGVDKNANRTTTDKYR